MYILSVSMWFQKLFRTVFFMVDQVVYNMISYIYDLLISIARTSVLSQADILDMADRIYKLLAIFMVFKVTLSLITYAVNPDQLNEKGKGISKLAANIVLSLGLLILTPYIFRGAYKVQTIILEDNTLATLIFNSDSSDGGEKKDSFLNSAGDEMSFITMSAFFSPNTSIAAFQECVDLTLNGKVRPECSGLNPETYEGNPYYTNSMYMLTNSTGKTLNDSGQSEEDQLKFNNTNFTLDSLQNYVVGVDNKNIGLMFRLDIATATVEDDTTFVMEYKYIFSTVLGVIIVLLLITFCMDVAVRSIKLAFLQLIAPIPIISYVDPKSGKEGMFKKWYTLCFKTFLSLFVRLLSLYFAVYIIGRISDLNLIDIETGAYQSSKLLKVFVIVGALMFAKDFPKILEGLGIKLDGGGKFTLNPLKKFEENASLGKNITGAVSGAATGLLGNKGNPFRAIGGAFRGFAGNQGFSGAAKHQANVNKQLRQAKLDGSTFPGRMNARWQNATGAKGFNNVEADRKKIEALKDFATAGTEIEERAVKKIQDGDAGDISRTYLSMDANAKKIQEDYSKNGTASYTALDGTTYTGADAVAQAQMDVNKYLNETGKYQYINDVKNNIKSDEAMKEKFKNYQARGRDVGKTAEIDGDKIHKQVGAVQGELNKLDRETRNTDRATQANQKFVEAAKVKK